MRSLAAKLGVTPEGRTLVVGPVPEQVLTELLEPDRRVRGETTYDVIVAFCRDRRQLDHHVEQLPERLSTAGGLWLCWLKKASGIATDIGETEVRTAGLATSLVDNLVVAIDEQWSGLRFVRRLSDR